MLRIGEFSKIAQVSVKTLRYYDRFGLLKPAWIDRFNGYRYYHIEQLASLNRILALKDLGFSLEQIQRILQEGPSAAELRRMMELKQLELEQQIRQDTTRLNQIAARLQQINDEGTLPQQEIIVKEVRPRLVAGLRQTVSSYGLIPQLYMALCRAMPAACQTADPSLPAAAIHLDREFAESGMRVEMVVPVTRQKKVNEPVRVYQLEGAAQMACLVHQGSLEEIPQAYQRLAGWVEANSYRITGPNREVYLRGIVPGADEKKQPEHGTTPHSPVITELQVPVERKPIPIFITKNKEYPQMEPKIVTKATFTVVGLKYFGKNENNEIAAMWGEGIQRFSEIKHITGPDDTAYGVCGNLLEDGSFEYIAGLEVSSTDNIPEGMESWEVPEQTYVVIPCTLTGIHQAYEYAHTEWIPQNNYKRAMTPDFEFYPDTFDASDPDSLLYIYVPIEKKD